MPAKVFIKLLGLFLCLLLFQTVAMIFIFHRIVERTAGDPQRVLGWQAFWSGLIALGIALLLAAWGAGKITSRLSARFDRVVTFAHRLAGGELSARVSTAGSADEFSAMEDALNRTAERLDRDFAELDSNRHELAAMLDAMQEAVVALTPEGVVRWSNSVMKRIAGREIIAGRSLVHSVRDPELLDCVRGALERGEICFGRASLLTPGQVFEISAAPLPSGGAVVVLHDVSTIEAAHKSRRDFVANVSHELRTPLTSIQGYVETLLDHPNPSAETTNEFLEIILKNAARMNRLTEDLLALATVESPNYKLALQPTFASVLVKDAVQSLGGIVVDSGVKLQLAGAPQDLVMADPDAMNQVFGNLIENSLKYAKDSKRIRVGAVPHESGVEFFVQDFGPGIASEHLERIFERFYRVDKARSRESGGTGLGLAIVKHLVQAHGGRVWAESELGNGASFHFTLPLAQMNLIQKNSPKAGLAAVAQPAADSTS